MEMFPKNVIEKFVKLDHWITLVMIDSQRMKMTRLGTRESVITMY